MTFSFFAFGFVLSLILNIVKIYKETSQKFCLRINTAANYHLFFKNKHQDRRRFRFSFFEMLVVLIICAAFFLLHFYFLDGTLRFYTLLLGGAGFYLSSFTFKFIKKPIQAICFPLMVPIILLHLYLDKTKYHLHNGFARIIDWLKDQINPHKPRSID